MALSSSMRGVRVAGCPWGSGADAQAWPWQTRLGPGASQWASCPSQQGWLLPLEQPRCLLVAPAAACLPRARTCHAACSLLLQRPACRRPRVVPGGDPAHTECGGNCTPHGPSDSGAEGSIHARCSRTDSTPGAWGRFARRQAQPGRQEGSRSQTKAVGRWRGPPTSREDPGDGLGQGRLLGHHEHGLHLASGCQRPASLRSRETAQTPRGSSVTRTPEMKDRRTTARLPAQPATLSGRTHRR